ncbi:MAG: helix-turn-helix transcriptional regulator [Clostridia bacterium]|nr:helix-turn-helix transcriptional regulator [Clostridia bacterium]
MSTKLLRDNFDELKRTMPSGKISDAVDFSLYWINVIDNTDVSFSQTVKKHHHNFFEIHFVLNGRMTYGIGGNSIELSSGDCLIFSPGQSHIINYYTNDLLKCSVSFALGEDEPMYEALVLKSGHLCHMEGYLYDSLAFICSKNKNESAYYDIIVKNRIFEIIHEIAGKTESKKTRGVKNVLSDGVDLRLFKAKQFIDDNPHVFLGCEDLAAYCTISSKQLNRIFLKYEGMSLLEYIHKIKAREAEKLLLQEKYSIRDVSENLGFSSVYYFNRFFLKHNGITPGEYRKKVWMVDY